MHWQAIHIQIVIHYDFLYMEEIRIRLDMDLMLLLGTFPNHFEPERVSLDRLEPNMNRRVEHLHREVTLARHSQRLG